MPIYSSSDFYRPVEYPRPAPAKDTTMTALDLYGDLPVFPTVYRTLTSEQIEIHAERLMDRADARFMAGKATQAQYDRWTAALHDWVDGLYAQFTA